MLAFEVLLRTICRCVISRQGKANHGHVVQFNNSILRSEAHSFNLILVYYLFNHTLRLAILRISSQLKSAL